MIDQGHYGPLVYVPVYKFLQFKMVNFFHWTQERTFDYRATQDALQITQNALEEAQKKLRDTQAQMEDLR